MPPSISRLCSSIGRESGTTASTPTSRGVPFCRRSRTASVSAAMTAQCSAEFPQTSRQRDRWELILLDLGTRQGLPNVLCTMVLRVGELMQRSRQRHLPDSALATLASETPAKCSASVRAMCAAKLRVSKGKLGSFLVHHLGSCHTFNGPPSQSGEHS